MPAPISVTPLSPPSSPPSSLGRATEPRSLPAVRPFVSEEFSERHTPELEPVSSFESAASGSSQQSRVRAGDPALSSRMAKLESQLRRLLAASLSSVDQAEDAPAGP